MSLSHDARRVRELLAPEAGPYALGMLALFAVNACDVIAPVFMAVAVDLTGAALTGEAPGTPPLLALVGLQTSEFTIGVAVVTFLVLQLAANVFRYPMLMNTAVPSHRIGQSLRNRLCAHMMSLSRPFYDRARSGDLMSLATNDVLAVRMMLGPGVLVGTDTLMIVTLVIGVLMTLSWKLTLIALLPMPIIAWFTNRLSHAEYERFEAVQEDIANLTERARESFAGIRVLQGYAREGFDGDRFEQYSWRHLGRQLRLARVRAVFWPSLDLMLGVSTVLVLVFGGAAVVDGTMTIGTFVAFLFLVGFLSGPMIGFGWSVTLFQRGRASLTRLDRFLAEQVDIDDAPDATELPDGGEGRIEVRGLTFAYAARPDEDGDGADERPRATGPVLHDVSFTLEPGRTLGIIGPVGAGKTTLVNLITRLYDPPPGTVLVDGHDVRDITLASLRARVVLAPQDTFLFSDTVSRNVLLGLDASDPDPRHFARLAHLADEIDALPRGYDTLLGERGVNLSGGQRQRLAIARAIATDPGVLVLDDCLSAVDARTEEAILRNMREVFAGRSGIVVSHRVAAVRDCDHILVLEGGRVTACGTHTELVAGGGYYARTAEAQSDAEAQA